MKALEKAARALLKRRWYDCEPEAWHDLETFYAQIDPDHVFDAYDEARAVIASIEVDDAADVVTLVALARHGIEPDVQQLLIAGDPMRGIRPGALRASLKAVLHSILVDGEGR